MNKFIKKKISKPILVEGIGEVISESMGKTGGSSTRARKQIPEDHRTAIKFNVYDNCWCAQIFTIQISPRHDSPTFRNFFSDLSRTSSSFVHAFPGAFPSAFLKCTFPDAFLTIKEDDRNRVGVWNLFFCFVYMFSYFLIEVGIWYHSRKATCMY